MAALEPYMLVDAAFQGDLHQIEILLDAGADVEAADGLGNVPLHAAIENWQPAAIERLLQRGASANQLDGDGWSPLAHAVELEWDEASGRDHRPRPELSSILIRYGADPDAAVPGYGTLREWVARIGYVEVSRLLPPQPLDNQPLERTGPAV